MRPLCGPSGPLLGGLGFLLWASWLACEPKPGEGGTSSLRGKVRVQDYAGSQLVAEYYAPEERVYLIYGNDAFYSEDVRTSYDGTYEFRYLKKGHYTVFAYSECDTCASGVLPVLLQAEIVRNNSVVELPDLVIRK
ncbi:MAG: hypothetical protein NZL95_02530 [Chitinophagales bacterium]|nr:hypothetical protein [Chitinophagales bacterium]MDW8427409.1 hypothetical protein [Chitinophagales bacterium]